MRCEWNYFVVSDTHHNKNHHRYHRYQNNEINLVGRSPGHGWLVPRSIHLQCHDPDHDTHFTFTTIPGHSDFARVLKMFWYSLNTEPPVIFLLVYVFMMISTHRAVTFAIHACHDIAAQDVANMKTLNQVNDRNTSLTARMPRSELQNKPMPPLPVSVPTSRRRAFANIGDPSPGLVPRILQSSRQAAKASSKLSAARWSSDRSVFPEIRSSHLVRCPSSPSLRGP